jgi:hypothetical protein
MATNHRTARGISVDMDRLRLTNETTIAVGNMRVNARGDQLGPGGKVVKTRSQVMAEKNKLHGAMANDDEVFNSPMDNATVIPDLIQNVPTNLVTNAADDTPVVETAGYVKPRGSFAGAVAEQTEVKQELLDPKEVLNTPQNQPGIKRI